MNILLEALMKIIMDGVIEDTKSRAVPKAVRYVLFGFICMLFLSVMGLFLYLGLKSHNGFWVSVVFLGFAVTIASFLTKLTREVILKLREEK